VEAGLQGISARIGDFVDPVLAAYGPTWAVVLLAALGLGVGHWIFVRG